LPSLEKLHQEFKNSPFALIAIDIKEDRNTVLKHIKSNGLSYTNLLDEEGTVSAMYGVSSTPIKFIIDKDGYMIGTVLGYRDWNKDEMKSLIRALIDPEAKR